MAKFTQVSSAPEHNDRREWPVIDTDSLVAGHYRVLERVGSGAMGVVWKARDERLGRTVAIKHLFAQPGLSEAETENGRRRAMREARIAAMLQHPNAISIFDIAEYDNDPCLVMEYLPSRGLDNILVDRGSLEPREVAAIGAQVASALAAAHEKGIVHRDIKPGNVLIDEHGIAKISDFGISRATGDATVTQTGVLAGTPAYLAPEIARGADPSSASDVFSLGATLYTAVEGYPPFGHIQNPLAALHAAAAGRVLPPEQAGPLTALLMNLLRSDPEERPSMAETAARLAAVAPGQGLTSWSAAVTTGANRPVRTPTRTAMPAAAVPAQQQKQPPKKGNSRVAVIAAMVAVALLIVLGGVGFTAGWFGGKDTGDTQRTAAGTRSSSPAQQEPQPSQQPQRPSTPDSSAQQPSKPDKPSDTGDTPSTGQIEYRPAGLLVIDFYNGLSDPSSAWSMLSPGAQQVYGSEEKFAAYWGKLGTISGSDARGVTPNDDGSVNVPVRVTAGGSATSKQVRVIRQDGKLYIDGDTTVSPVT